MGCWNQTCGLTQIHIRASEKVLVFPLVESHRDSMCYSTPFWTPFPIPFASEYNDYGGGENSSGLGLNMIISCLQSKLVEIEQGENQYHDIAVKREGFDEDKFWEAIHEMRLKIHSYNNAEKEVGFVMIKQSVVDYLIEHEVFEHYEGYDEKGSKYTKYKFADILTTLEVVLDKLFASDDDSSIPEELRGQLKFLMRYRALERVAGEVHEADKHNWAADWLRFGGQSHLSYGAFSSTIVTDALGEYIEAGNREGARELLTQYLIMQFVDSFMMSTRKFWSPQAGAGSQNDNPDGYRLLAAAMINVLDVEKAERDSWDE